MARIYRNNLKNRNLDKKVPQIEDPGQAALFIDRQRGSDPEFEEKPAPSKTDSSGCFGINNTFYSDLGTMWYAENDHPIALLRAENALRNPWIAEKIAEKLGKRCSILDVGCGGGFLTNFLDLQGHKVSGVDLSASSLDMARLNNPSGNVDYHLGNASALPFPDAHFDAVSAMDLLEHVENPAVVIQEASRVLKPGGMFFFHTFNRNLLSYLFVIKGVEWCVKNTPANMHVYPLFIKPRELKQMCASCGLHVGELKGVAPRILSTSFWRMVFTGRVDDRFSFRFLSSLATGYSGFAIKT